MSRANLGLFEQSEFAEFLRST
jgi:hypothetical protein